MPYFLKKLNLIKSKKKNGIYKKEKLSKKKNIPANTYSTNFDKYGNQPQNLKTADWWK